MEILSELRIGDDDMRDNVLYVPVYFSLPKEDGIYAVKRDIKGNVVKDIVWRIRGCWLTMEKKPIPEENIKAWEYKEDQ